MHETLQLLPHCTLQFWPMTHWKLQLSAHCAVQVLPKPWQVRPQPEAAPQPRLHGPASTQLQPASPHEASPGAAELSEVASLAASPPAPGLVASFPESTIAEVSSAPSAPAAASFVPRSAAPPSSPA